MAGVCLEDGQREECLERNQLSSPLLEAAKVSFRQSEGVEFVLDTTRERATAVLLAVFYMLISRIILLQEKPCRSTNKTNWYLRYVIFILVNKVPMAFTKRVFCLPFGRVRYIIFCYIILCLVKLTFSRINEVE